MEKHRIQQPIRGSTQWLAGVIEAACAVKA
jgi:hypothetical protein